MKKEKEKKEPRRKPKYGYLSCVWYSLKLTWKADKSIAFASVAIVPVSVILNAINLYLPTIILRQLEAQTLFGKIAAVIAAMAVSLTIFSLLNSYISTKRADAELFLFGSMYIKQKTRKLDMDRFLHLDPDIQTVITRAEQASSNNHAQAVHFTEYFATFLVNILNFLLFGAVISTLNPLILLLLAGGSLIHFFIEKWRARKNWENKDERDLVEKKLNYLAYTVSNNLNYAKDIRLFGFAGFIDRLIAKLTGQWIGYQEKIEKYAFFSSMVSYLIVLLRDGAAYAVLLSQALSGKINASEFVLYFSAISRISSFFDGILSTFTKLYDGALSVSDYREYFDVRDKLHRGEGVAPPKSAPSVEFKNVSFKYPSADSKVLDNVSFKISAGEKIALVGANGAGKTTLTMLMCGLLVPDEGEVLIDGHSVFEYNRDDLYSLFSLVPQNYSLLPLSIAENISLADREAGEETDPDLLHHSLELSGLAEKVYSLPSGVKTPLNRQINEGATDLSGGEIQKLLLARAIYRGAPILILDEPTAALDPIAEDGIYRKYSEISENCTSVFISHRLASTRFCDRIFYLDGAGLAETGSHDELMALGGKYRKLFDVQSKYYREEAHQ